MGIAEGYKANLETIQRAAENNDLALMECTDKRTKKPVVVLCAVYRDEGGMCNMVPLAKMFDGNPYEEMNPPILEESA